MSGVDKSLSGRKNNAQSVGNFIMQKMMTTKYDVAEHLRTPDEIAAYWEAYLDEADDDTAFIAKALGDIAHAKGIAQVATDAGLS